MCNLEFVRPSIRARFVLCLDALRNTSSRAFSRSNKVARSLETPERRCDAQSAPEDAVVDVIYVDGASVGS